MNETTLQYAFVALLAVFAVSGLGLRRARSRQAVALVGALPFAAWLGWEWLVSRAMPHADIRIDWLLLLPIALAHGAHALARWRRLD